MQRILRVISAMGPADWFVAFAVSFILGVLIEVIIRTSGGGSAW